MKINEVEALTGISKKNIRFYEEQQLLSPRRNTENGYRDYGEAEVQTLRRIRLLRKLGVPIEEIRRMALGIHTLGDGMRRHLVTLERERQNLECCISLCRELSGMDIPLSEFDADGALGKMEEMERSGASFAGAQSQDVRVRYVAPVIITILMIGLMTGVAVLFTWAWMSFPEEAPPAAVLVVLILFCLSVGIGVILALFQRIREIGKGELESSRKF